MQSLLHHSRRLGTLVERYSDIAQRALLLVAAIVFGLALVLYVCNWLGALPTALQRFAPASILGVLTPALTVVLMYEMMLLALALRHSLVRFTQVLFEVVSLVILRELFKRLDHLVLAGPLVPAELLELMIVMAGSLALYFLIEVLERVQRRYSRRVDFEPRRLVAVKQVLSAGATVGLSGLILLNTVGWLLGWPSAGFDMDFLRVVFSLLVLVSAALLLASILFVHTYETVFEYSALTLSAVVCLLALGLPPVTKVMLVTIAAVFSIGTLSLHGFARGDSLSDPD